MYSTTVTFHGVLGPVLLKRVLTGGKYPNRSFCESSLNKSEVPFYVLSTANKNPMNATKSASTYLCANNETTIVQARCLSMCLHTN